MHFDALTAYLDALPGRGIPGCDMTVWQDHRPVYRHRAGERAPGVPMDGHETYWLYSATKLLTMTAATQLIERGALRLDDPVADYLPAYAHLSVNDGGRIRPARTVMTLEHLMTMQGGLDYDVDVPSVHRLLDAHPNATTRQVAEAFAEKTLLFDPGTRFRYSLCHDVVAAVAEVASGQRFSDYVRENITGPLGMRTATFHPTDAEFNRMAQRWRWNEREQPVPDDNFDNPFCLSPACESGGAGLVSELDSYILLLDALANGGVGRSGARILSPASIDVMRRNRLTGPSRADYDALCNKVGYGYGLGVRTLTDASASRSPLGEFGWDGAAGAWMMIDPDHHLAAFYLQHVLNCGRAFSEFHPAIRDLIYEGLDL